MTVWAARRHERPRADGVLARNTLVTLSLTSGRDSDELRLVPAPGVKINALLKPAIERPFRRPVVFDAFGRTSDSGYFVLPPAARIARERPLVGTLRASACPEGKRLCVSTTLPVSLRD